MIRAGVAVLTVSVALFVSATASAVPEASVLSVNYKAGASSVDVVLAIPKGIDTAARNGNPRFALHMTLTYLALDNTFVTLDSGRIPLTDTTVLGPLDRHTVSVLYKLPLGGLSGPGSTPSYSSTVEILTPGND